MIIADGSLIWIHVFITGVTEFSITTVQLRWKNLNRIFMQDIEKIVSYFNLLMEYLLTSIKLYLQTKYRIVKNNEMNKIVFDY